MPYYEDCIEDIRDFFLGDFFMLLTPTISGVELLAKLDAKIAKRKKAWTRQLQQSLKKGEFADGNT